MFLYPFLILQISAYGQIFDFTDQIYIDRISRVEPENLLSQTRNISFSQTKIHQSSSLLPMWNKTFFSARSRSREKPEEIKRVVVGAELSLISIARNPPAYLTCRFSMLHLRHDRDRFLARSPCPSFDGKGAAATRPPHGRSFTSVADHRQSVDRVSSSVSLSSSS